MKKIDKVKKAKTLLLINPKLFYIFICDIVFLIKVLLFYVQIITITRETILVYIFLAYIFLAKMAYFSGDLIKDTSDGLAWGLWEKKYSRITYSPENYDYLEIA
jgi:hypothetical protein